MKIPPHFSARTKSSEAFSLIELLVVIAILGVLAVMASSALPGKVGGEVTQAGETLSSLATLAREHAMSKNTLTVLLVGEVKDGAGMRSAASIWDAGTTNQLDKWNVLPESVIATDTSNFTPDVFSGARFRGQLLTNSSAFWFFPDGRMGNDPAKMPKLSIASRRGGPNSYELVFNPVIGTHKSQRP